MSAVEVVDYTHALFTIGQGSQKIGNGKELADQSPAARIIWEKTDHLLLPTLGFRFSSFVFEGKHLGIQLHLEEAQAILTRTEQAQPAVVADALARAAALEEAGLLGEPGWHAYNSVGIIAAAVNAGALSVEGAVRLGEGRGRAFDHAVAKSPKTTMFALIGVEDERVEDIREKFGLEYCLLNSDTQIVLGGEVENKTGHDVTHALSYLEDEGLRDRVTVLDVEAAFHSRWFELAVPIYQAAVESESIVDPTNGKLVGGTTVRVLETAADVRNEMVLQLTRTEKTRDVWHFLRKQGVTTVIELSGEASFMGTLRRQFGGKIQKITAKEGGPVYAFRWSAQVEEAKKVEVKPAVATVSRNEISAWYMSWLADRSGLEVTELKEEMLFKEDVGLDSEDGKALRASIRAKFGKVIPDEEAVKNLTVASAIDATYNLMNS